MAALLSHYGIDSPDFVIATHGHADHAGGLTWLLAQGRSGSLVLPAGASAPVDPGMRLSETPISPFAKDDVDRTGTLIAAAALSGIAVKRVSAHDRMELGSRCTLTVLHPTAGDGTPRTDDANAGSLLLRVDCRGFSFLVTGDADAATERMLVDEGAWLDADLLRVAHHGSAHSTGTDFLEAVTPWVSVVSVGPNLYGHPSAETLDRIAATGCRLLRTDRDGAIVVEVRSSGARIRSWIGGVDSGETG
jgi:competence protein ComEC